MSIQAQPLDEITEVWQESQAFFGALCLLMVLIFLAVNLVFNHALKAIAIIVDTVQRIETGQYRYQLPAFAVQEFDQIAKAINHMTQVLEQTRRENQALTHHSLAIQEEERQRLAQELHDELGQSLTAIKMMAATTRYPQADTVKISADIVSICDHLMQVVRSMMQQLHPLVLTELGLKAALEDMVYRWSERYPELKVTIDCDEAVDGLDKAISIQLFRVIQECLTNVVRHAQAEWVDVVLEQTDDGNGLKLSVADDGQGYDEQHLKNGFGVLSMKERVKSLSGELHLQSGLGQGTTVTAWIPLS